MTLHAFALCAVLLKPYGCCHYGTKAAVYISIHDIMQLCKVEMQNAYISILVSISHETADPDLFSLSVIGQQRIDVTKRNLLQNYRGAKKKYPQMKNS